MIKITPSCLEEDIIAELVGARLGTSEAAAAEAHIDTCVACRQLLAELLRQRTPPTPLSTPPAAARNVDGSVGDGGAAGGLESGTQLGRFIVRQRLGEGGMGVVYVAYDPELAREVALKLVRPRSAASVSPQIWQDNPAHKGEPVAPDRAQLRLLREAQAMARLSHPNVRAVYEVGTALGQVYIAMELVHGMSARAYLRTAPRSVPVVLELFVQAGQGLAAAHEAGLLHRDFKPDNILVSLDRRVLITDFGLARDEGGNNPGEPERRAGHQAALPLTHSGTALGTPGYTAPEQLRCDELDARADQWSFCAALYEALYGTRPFVGATLAELIAAMNRGAQIPLRARAVPAWLRRVVRRGLCVDPAHRFPSMTALLAELHRGPRQIRARRTAIFTTAALVTILFGLGASYMTWVRPEQLCVQEARRQIHKVWNPELRTQAEQATLALHLPYGGEVIRRVTAALDTYADRWSGAATELCQTARPRRALPENILTARARCLDLRLRELSALSAQLVVADAATVERAVAASAGLSSIGDCRSSHVASARHQLPSEPADRQRADAAYRELAQAQALQRTGHSPQALLRIDQAMAQVKTVSHRPLWAELQLLRGGLELDAGNLRPAAAALHDAVLAGEASGHDEALARAFIKLIEVDSRDALLDQAEGFAQHAAAVIERLGGDLHLSALLTSNLAMLRLAQGRRAEALQQQERALVLLDQSGTASAIETAKLLTNLGALQTTLGRHREALVSHNRAVAIFERELGPAHPAVANALLNLGATLGASDDSAGEIAAYERCLQIWEPTLGRQHVNLGMVHHNLGTALQLSGKPSSALPHFEQALVIKRQHLAADHPSIASTLFSTGATLHKLGQHAAGLLALTEALQSYQKRLGTNHPLVAKALTEIGLVHLDAGRQILARQHLERALHTGADADLDPSERAETRFGLARALRAADREPARADALARQALHDYADPQYASEQATITAWLQAAK